MAIEVRAVRPEEYQEAGRVTVEAFREFVEPGDSGWERYIDYMADVGARAGRTTVLVAADDGEIVGTVTLELDDRAGGGETDEPLEPGEAHVRTLGVHPRARQRGAGRALMDACIEEARRAEKRLITLTTAMNQIAAHVLYESMGFVRGPDGVLPDGEAVRTYSLPLDR